MTGQDDPGLASLPPDRKLLRTFDLGAVAIRDLAADRTGRAPRRRPPVGRRRQPAAAPLRRPRRRGEPDLPAVRDPARGVRVRRPRPSTWSRTWSAWGWSAASGSTASASPRRQALLQQVLGGTVERAERRRDARAVRGRPVHRRGDGARVSRRRDDPADRRRLDARRQRRTPRPLGRPDADLAPRGPPARGREGRARRGGGARTPVQPEGPHARSGSAWTSSRRAPRSWRRRSRRPWPRACSWSTTSARPPTTRSRTTRSASSRPPACRRRAVARSTPRSSSCLLVGEPSPASLPLLAQHAKAAGDADGLRAVLARGEPDRARRERTGGGAARGRGRAPVRRRSDGAGQAPRGPRSTRSRCSVAPSDRMQGLAELVGARGRAGRHAARARRPAAPGRLAPDAGRGGAGRDPRARGARARGVGW